MFKTKIKLPTLHMNEWANDESAMFALHDAMRDTQRSLLIRIRSFSSRSLGAGRLTTNRTR
jgi:hypothetical protein